MNLILLILCLILSLGRPFFGFTAPSAFGGFEALGHIYVGFVLAFLGASIDPGWVVDHRGIPFFKNGYLWLLLVPSLVELACFLIFGFTWLFPL